MPIQPRPPGLNLHWPRMRMRIQRHPGDSSLKPRSAGEAPTTPRLGSPAMRERPWAEDTDLPIPLIPLERTFEGFLGLEWLALSEDSAHARFEVRENLKQPLGLLHGGI